MLLQSPYIAFIILVLVLMLSGFLSVPHSWELPMKINSLSHNLRPVSISFSCPRWNVWNLPHTNPTSYGFIVTPPLLFYLELSVRLELTTYWLQVSYTTSCATTAHMPSSFRGVILFAKEVDDDKNRTCDTKLPAPALPDWATSP